MDTIFPEEDTTMNPYGEYSTFESDEKKNTEKTFLTTTPMEDTKKLTPQELYTKYANTVPPFPLFPNVTPPSFPNLSAAQQNSCSTAEIDYTKQIKEAASYINQEKFDVKLPLGIEKIKNKLKKKPTVVEDPIVQAAAVIQQALNISNSSSLNCVCNDVASSIRSNEDSSEAIEFDMSSIKTNTLNFNINQKSDQTTTVTNVLSEKFTNTVNNSIKNNLNIFASQVNKVKNASPTGLGNSQKFFNAIQNSLMNVMNNNTVSNTANTEFTEKKNKISITNVDAKTININDVQKTVKDTYVKNVTNSITDNALKNIGINDEGITALLSNTDDNTKNFGEGDDNDGEGKEEENNEYFYFLFLFFFFYLPLILLPLYMKKHNNESNPPPPFILKYFYNQYAILFYLVVCIALTIIFFIILTPKGKYLYFVGVICAIFLFLFLLLSIFTPTVDWFGLENVNTWDKVSYLRKFILSFYKEKEKENINNSNNTTKTDTNENRIIGN